MDRSAVEESDKIDYFISNDLGNNKKLIRISLMKMAQ